MPPHTAGQPPATTPAGTVAPRPPRAAWRLSAPVARGVSVAVGAALIACGVPAAAGPAAGHAGTAAFDGVGGIVGPQATERSLAAQTARLVGQGERAADASRAESLAVARAALHAAVAVAPLVAGAQDATVDRELDAAVRLLSGLADAAGSPGARMRADVPLPVSAPADAAAATVRAATAVGVPAEAALTEALARSAGDVFRLAMRVEALSGATTQSSPVAVTASLERLETAVSATDAAVAAIELVPLTPLTDAERPTPSAGTADEPRPAPGARSGTSRARLRADVAPAVAAFVGTWANGQVPADALCVVPFAPGHRLQCDAAEALAGLNIAYRAQFGRDLDVVSSYRPLQTQVALRAAKGGLAAVPGTSNHGWGIAVDLGGIGGLGQFDSPGYRWLKEHAGAHGWHHPRVMEPGGGGPQEPWHWEFGTA